MIKNIYTNLDCIKSLLLEYNMIKKAVIQVLMKGKSL